MKKYNIEIIYMKLYFTMVIFLYHAHKFDLCNEIYLFERGAIAVEFFFMISGYFMAVTLHDKRKKELSTIHFVKNKILNIYSVYFVSWIIAFVIRQVLLNVNTVITLIKNLCLGLPELFLLQMAGISFGRIYDGSSWYISAMILTMCVLYPLARKYNEYFLGGG